MLGVITGAHGVRGEVRIKTFTAEPDAIVAYGALTDEAGAKRYALALRARARGQVIARVEGIADRNAAERLAGVKLCVPRAALPRPRREQFYLADLIGMVATDGDGTALGSVRAVHNFGAGDVIEIAREGQGEIYLPFTRRCVPAIDIVARTMTVALPDPDAPKRPRRARRKPAKEAS